MSFNQKKSPATTTAAAGATTTSTSTVSADSTCSTFFTNYLRQRDHLPFVSICTPTFNRRPFIQAIANCIQNQTYPLDRMEWVVVDDGTDKVNDIFADDAFKKQLSGLHIKYHEFDKKMPLGAKRNLMHTFATGDIIVYMDDDDWYPPDRVAHSVQTLLINPNILIAGASEIFIYCPEESQMYKLGPYGSNHATAGTFAFRRELLDITRYDESAAVAEEQSFLKNNTIPLVQMNPRHTILVFIHDQNSFDKRVLLKNAGVAVKVPVHNGIVVPHSPHQQQQPPQQMEERIFVAKSDVPLETFFPRPRDMAHLSFYLSLQTRLAAYDAGLVKHKPDVVQQVQHIWNQQQMNAPLFPITIDGEDRKISYNEVMALVKHIYANSQNLADINKQLTQRVSELTELQVQAESNTRQSDHFVAQLAPLHERPAGQREGTEAHLVDVMRVNIPGLGERAMTQSQINKLVDIQTKKINELTVQLSKCANLSPNHFYLLDAVE